MNTLVVMYLHIPLKADDHNGLVRRCRAFLHALHEVSHQITLLQIVPADQIDAAGPLDRLSQAQSEFWGVPLRIALVPRRPRTETAWRHYGAGILNAEAQPTLFPYGGEAVANAVAAHLDQQPDLVFAQGLPAMLPILRSRRRPRRLVFDMIDVEHKVMFRQAFSAPRYLGKPARLLQVPALMALERRSVAASHLTFVCSDTDRAYLRRTGFGDTIRVVPNALALPADPPGVVKDGTVLFLGDAGYPPNHYAAERMARRIWPRVHAAMPDARLLIAGRGSDLLLSAAEGLPGVEHLGFVPDLDALYARSRVVCAPIMTGGGTRLKLVEAASYARPMVSTRIGAEGLDFVDGQQALLRDDDAGFADACVALLRDDALCRRLGEAARAVMAAEYDVRRVEARIVEMIGSVSV